MKGPYCISGPLPFETATAFCVSLTVPVIGIGSCYWSCFIVSRLSDAQFKLELISALSPSYVFSLSYQSKVSTNTR